jgi:hypothetical protein
VRQRENQLDIVKNRGVKKPIAENSVSGQVEQKLERRAAVWRRRCEGATMTRVACEFGMSIGAIYNYIEEARKQLREATIDLAAQEREQSLALIDTAIEQVMPHINGEIKIETEVHRVIKGRPQTFKMTIEDWQARMKGCQVLTQLLDRKAKLLGMDAPVKVEPPPVVVPETEEQRARAREALKTWCKFAVNPADFMSKDVS